MLGRVGAFFLLVLTFLYSQLGLFVIVIVWHAVTWMFQPQVNFSLSQKGA